MTEEYRAEHELAEQVAIEAGSLALEGFRSALEVTKKGRVDLVTNYDVKCEDLIRARISAAFPRDHIVAEEQTALIPRAESNPRVWYVDPIDGTTNFAHGSPLFSISIGFYHHIEEKFGGGRVGVVHAPALGVTWSALRGHGAFRTSTNKTPCKVSDTATLQDALVATGFAYDRATTRDNNLREFSGFMPRVQGIRRMGSAALDFAFVADGTFDFYWERGLSPWDLAAGVVLVREAGGVVTDYQGGEPSLDQKSPNAGRLVASNGALHGVGIELLRANARESVPPETQS